ncbi:MAG: class I SAM-dependent methyltransferase [Parvibaculum sp.]
MTARTAICSLARATIEDKPILPDTAAKTATPEACMICGGTHFTALGAKNGYNLFRCGDCRLSFVHPMPGESEIAAIYEKYVLNDSYKRRATRKIIRSTRRLRRYLHMAPGKRFLDMGCSIGTSVEAARRLGCDAYGIDIDESSIGIARDLFPDGHYHAGPIESMPPAWGQFDFLFSVEVLEHLPDPHAYFQALAPRARSGALLYLTTPDGGHWRVPRTFTEWEHVNPPQHLVFYNRDAITRFLDRHGFDVVKFEWNLKPGLKLLARKR